MTDRETVKQTAELLRGIIRSIDKKLEYSVVPQAEEGSFALHLSTRNREGLVVLRTDDVRAAGTSATRRNTIRQKIKSKRDHMLSNYVEDVMGVASARILKQSAAARDEFKLTSFRRAPMGRRR